MDYKTKWFTLHLSDRKIAEVTEKQFIDYNLSDLYIGGQCVQTSEHKEDTFFMFQTIGYFTEEDVINIKEFVKNYEQ